MLNQKNAVEILRKKLPYLRDSYGVRRIGLFGSFAKGEQNKHSDIDFIVEFDEPTFDNYMDLIFYLEDLFGRKVEILTPDGVRSIRIKKVADNIKRGVIYV